MRYDFDRLIDRRNTNALNTDGFRGYIFHAGPEKVFPYKDEEFVRMWVADMEFATPQPIRDAMKARIDREIFGYSAMFTDDYYNAFSTWCREKYDWTFPKEELVFSPGIIPALYQLAEILMAKNEKMLTFTPAYGYFLHTAEYNNVEMVNCDLKIAEDGTFSIDFDDFERKCADPKMKIVVLCNPHNPSGRMWTAEELGKISAITEKYNLWIISDEIHCDLIRCGKKHIPMGKIMPDYKKLITCMSASKTFNMAGLMMSDIIIRDESTRREFCARDKIAGFLNPLSVAAHQAAYEHCGPWLEELKAYLDGNFAFVKDFLTEYLPEAVMAVPEATYLAWVNIGRCIPDIEDHCDFFANKAGVLLEGGNGLFVGNASGYIRLNLAMPRSIIQTGMERIRDAIYAHNGK